MTIEATITHQEFAGTGAVDDFDFTLRTDDRSWITVYLDGVLQVAGYTLTLNADQDVSPGGRVAFITPPGDDVEVKIKRWVPFTQITDYEAYDRFPAETHELTLDRIVMMIQQLVEMDGALQVLAAGLIYDLAAYIPETMSASAVVARWTVARTVNFPAGMTGSRASSGVAATASTVLEVQKNGVEVATITFGVGGTTGTYAATDPWGVSPGDVVQIVAPASPDATLAQVSLTMVGERSP